MDRSVVELRKLAEDGIRSKVDRLAELLEQAIGAGQFKPGERFPSTYQIAREYGVSQGTARKAMGELARRKYLKVSGRLGFFLRPEAARLANATLAPVTSPVVVVLIGDIAPGGVQVLEDYLVALRQGSARHGWEVVVVRNQREEIRRAIANRRFVGCLAYGLREPPAAEIDLTSTIIWSRSEDWRDPACSIMGVDQDTAARLAYEHLWDLGHQRTALVRLKERTESTPQMRGFLLGMRRAYASMRHIWSPRDVIEVTPENLRGLYDQICDSGVTGICCIDWDVTMELYRQAQRRGERIGDQLSMVTVGGFDGAEELCPAPARIRWRSIDYADIVIDALLQREQGRSMPFRLAVPVYLEEGPGAGPAFDLHHPKASEPIGLDGPI